jgi:hypothetical protein
MAALKNRTRAHREIFLALITAVVAVLARGDSFAQTAYWAFGAFRPKVLFKIDPRRLLIRNISNSSKVEMVILLMTCPYLMRKSRTNARESSV